jgi:2-polyprenyl-3-methyl-5-hydroxy-6-metoxy-1,4-benzoquinol methylase
MPVEVRERWNHNNHYHDRLLSELPPALDRALDVGCGHGFFAARLAERAVQVDAVDVDAGVVAEAERLHGSARVTFRAGDFLALRPPAESYDAVTSIAALHHMELSAALHEMRRVLRPGGHLALVGLYRARTPADFAVAGLAVVPNWIRTRLLDPADPGSLEMTAPIRPPAASLREIRAAAGAELPGARVHRHLYWRYSLCWRKA